MVKNFIEFLEKFHTEEACIQHIMKKKWPNGFVCSRCGHNMYYRLKTVRNLQCKQCSKQVSITANTVFHKTRTPFRAWFYAIWMIARDKKSISARQLEEQFSMNCEAAWTMLQKIRSSLEEKKTIFLDGLIETDEAYIGGKAVGKRGRGAANKSIVQAGVEVVSGKNGEYVRKIRMQKVIDITSSSLLKPILKWTTKDSVIKTDGLKSYNSVSKFRKHIAIPLIDPKNASVELPHVHKIFSNFQTWLQGRFYGVSDKHLPRYIAEFEYRTNRRHSLDSLFDFVINRCVKIGRAPYYKELTADNPVYFIPLKLNKMHNIA